MTEKRTFSDNLPSSANDNIVNIDSHQFQAFLYDRMFYLNVMQERIPCGAF